MSTTTPIIRRVLVAVDKSRLAERVVAKALTFSQRSREVGAIASPVSPPATIDLFHVISIPPELPSNLWAVSGDELFEISSAEARAALEPVLASIPSEMRGELIVQVGIPWSEICACARERAVDLVVIGAHEHGLVDRVLGTTAAKVANHIDRPLLIVR